MTHVCYTLEEAADKLKLSETVLVRLSQYFKVPKAAYEEVGYLSFKGDLAFSEPDIVFFRQAKERLLNGESLDDVKRRLYADSIAQPPQWVETPPPSLALDAPGPGAAPSRPVSEQPAAPPSGVGAAQAKSQADASQAAGMPEPIREIQDRKPYEKAAERSFERYKSMHRTGLSKVFENMLKEVGLKEVGTATSAHKRPGTAGHEFRPLREKRNEKPTGAKASKGKAQPEDTLRSDTLLPFSRNAMMAGPEPMTSTGPSVGSWEHLIQEAASRPRVMNTQLKNAAQILRQRATGHQEERSSS
jgi:hypothetical protein